MAIKAGADHGAVQNIERRKQGRGSVSNIVVGQRSTASLFHRQPRLSSIQCLNLGFFVHAQNQRLIRRIEIQTDHVGELFHELFVAGQLEIAHAMGLQTVAVPYPGHRHVTDSKSARQGPAAPMSGILGFGMQSSFHDGLDLIILGPLRTGLARRLVLQTGHPALQKMMAPKQHGGPTHFELLRNATIGQARMRQQTNARPQHNLLRSRRSLDPVLQLALLFVG